MTNGVIQQADGGLDHEFELVAKGDTGDAVVQQSDGNYAVSSVRQAGSGAWRFTTTLGAPSTGRISLDNATQDSATKFFVHKTDTDGFDLALFLATIEVGDAWYVQEQASQPNFKVWSIDTITDQGTYIEYDVTLMNAGSDLSNNAKCIVSLQPNAGTLEALSLAAKEARSDTPTTVPATPADYILYIDSVTKEANITTVSEMLDNALVVATDSGTGTDIDSTATPTALPIFDTDFYSSTPVVTDTAGDLGITVGVPIRYSVAVIGSLEAGGNTDFTLEIFVGGVVCGQAVVVSGAGVDKFVPFALQCISPVVTPGDTVELRVSDDGDTLDTINASMIVRFAGL